MRFYAIVGVIFKVLIPLLIFSASSSVQAASPFGKQRHALVIGVSEYKEKSGLGKLNAPANDAEDVKYVLERLRDRFTVDLLTNDQVKDKETFQAAFNDFLNKIEPGDDALFYFSGHGFSSSDKKNYFLLPSAKGKTAYLQGLDANEQTSLDSQDKKDKKYQQWIAQTAVSEDDIEAAIRKKNASDSNNAGVIIIIADACRNLLEGTKGAAVDPQTMGVVLPRATASGTFRLYSASFGQFSLDSPEPYVRPNIGAFGYKPQQESPDKNGKEKAKTRNNSLFTRALLTQIDKPGLEISVMAAYVKNAVRSQARKISAFEQIPDFSESVESTDFYFVSPSGDPEYVAYCHSVEAELAQLRYGVAAGNVGRDTFEEKKNELSRCSPKIKDQLEALARIFSQGTGLFVSQTGKIVESENLTDPQQICDVKGSSPLDPDRPTGISGLDLQKIAVAAIAGEADRAKTEQEIKGIVDACEKAAEQRPRVARFKFNAARGNYVLATMTEGVERVVALKRASLYNAGAAELGYPAAYNNLALMIQKGEFYNIGADAPEPADREKAASYYTRGANLNHVVAQYNLGMAYYNGDLGLSNSRSTSKLSYAKAYEFLSVAAERGYVPAMIETAKMLFWGFGVPRNTKHAFELLQAASTQGNWDAMYWLGDFHYRESNDGQSPDAAQAVVWFARAAEAGDVDSQEMLARLLTEGYGVPSPQPEASGRYWRLAAYSGSRSAQVELARLLRDRKIPFRPVLVGKPDDGAAEIRNLYLEAFLRGNPVAGLELARLYRTGYPQDIGSEAIPKNPESVIALLYRTINKVRLAEPGSEEADPKTEAYAAFELLSMADKGEATRPDGSALLTEDQVRQLRNDYGAKGKIGYIRASALEPIRCRDEYDRNPYQLYYEWILVWDWDRDELPIEPQLRWLERKEQCKEREFSRAKAKNESEPKLENIGFTKEIREKLASKFKEARADAKEHGAGAKSYYERLAELVSPKEGKRRR